MRLLAVVITAALHVIDVTSVGQNSESQISSSPYGPSPPSAHSSSTSLASSSTSWTPTLATSASRPSSITTKVEKAVERIVEWQNLYATLPRKVLRRAEDPLGAITSWLVEHFQFGACLLDPVGIRERYKALEAWEGHWVNIWTEVPAKGKDRGLGGTAKAWEEEDKYVRGALPSNTADVLHFANAEKHASDSESRSRAKARKAAGKALRKERKKERKPGSSSARPARHFIVLPDVEGKRTESRRYGSLERWERFPILNVADEVEAHCGLFIRSKNPMYEKLVERVADVILDWSKTIR